jgi:hypothetical protein
LPSLRSLGLDVNPSKEPLRYPGALVRESCLLAGSWLYPLIPAPGAPIAEWVLAADGGRLRHTPIGGPQGHTLDGALRLARSPLMAERFPVVAVGSNASPGQLAHKFTSGRYVDEIVPMTLARVRGIALGHSAHISRAGYVPYVPLAADLAAERTLFILWLDRTQWDRIDETEGNYEPVTVRRDHAPAVLETGERVAAFSMYRGRLGALRLARDEPPIEATNQEAVVRLLDRLPWFRDLVPESRLGAPAAVRALADCGKRRSAVRERFIAEGLAGDDGFAFEDLAG